MHSLDAMAERLRYLVSSTKQVAESSLLMMALVFRGLKWPEVGKLGAVIAHSLKQNAKAKLDVRSNPNEGMRVNIFFAREAAEPEPV